MSKVIIIHRLLNIGKKCFGVMIFNDKIYHTLENKDFIFEKGFYFLGVHNSAKFKREMPILKDVIGRTEILIHGGNTIADTEGCILVGRKFVHEKTKDFDNDIYDCKGIDAEIVKSIKSGFTEAIIIF